MSPEETAEIFVDHGGKLASWSAATQVPILCTAVEPVAAPAGGAERFEGAPLPRVELARVVPMARPRPATFRELLRRSLALRVRG